VSQTGTALPFVSVIIPCYNEARFVAAFLDSVLANDYPRDRREILLVDGMSDDGTRDIVEAYAARWPELRLVDNPRRSKPAALNSGIAESRGDVIVRLDVHAEYDRSYLRKSVRGLLDNPAADNVGGILRSQPRDDTLIGRAIALATTHVFGVGDSRFRVGVSGPQWVDTVFGGCYRRRVFDEIGGFDETLIRAQDREFNHRLRDSGGRILLLPDIVCTYYPRSGFREYVSWIFEAGYWPYYASRLADRWIGSWRNLVPPGFVLVLAATGAASVVVPAAGTVALVLLTLYCGASFGCAAQLAWRHREPALLLAMPVVFATTHVVYGAGALWGLVAPLPARDRQSEWVLG
jgi:glycosyltransferase involved in cell wall biosynthesis